MSSIRLRLTWCLTMTSLMSCWGCQWAGNGDMDVTVADMITYQAGPNGRAASGKPVNWQSRRVSETNGPALAVGNTVVPSSDMHQGKPNTSDPIEQAVASLQQRMRNLKTDTPPPAVPAEPPVVTQEPPKKEIAQVAFEVPIAPPVVDTTAVSPRASDLPVVNAMIAPPPVSVESASAYEVEEASGNPLRDTASGASVGSPALANPLR